MALSSNDWTGEPEDSPPNLQDADAYVIQGDNATYQVKEQLKSIGLQWHPEYEVWWTHSKKKYSKAYDLVQKERGFRSPNQTNMFDS